MEEPPNAFGGHLGVTKLDQTLSLILQESPGTGQGQNSSLLPHVFQLYHGMLIRSVLTNFQLHFAWILDLVPLKIQIR